MILVVAGLWFSKSITRYEEQVQEYEIEQIDTECQLMLSKMAIHQEQRTEFMLVAPQTPNADPSFTPFFIPGNEDDNDDN